MHNLLRISVTAALAVALVSLFAPLARADHTEPGTALQPTDGAPVPDFLTAGEGTWEFITNFPAPTGPALTGGSTDHRFFTVDGDIYASVGTLGQGNEMHVGQRIIRLTEKGEVNPTWVADHGSAACSPANTSVTGLQHDQAVVGTISKRNAAKLGTALQPQMLVEPELLLDTTNATGRCHDAGGGGIEIVDISGLGDPDFEVREIHLVRLVGTSHTVTVDDRRPWIAYNNTSSSVGAPWIDVLDLRSCLGLGGLELEEKRAACRPTVYRIPFQPKWSERVDPEGNRVEGSASACHDITPRFPRIYCAGLNATLIFDVGKLTARNGAIRGKPLDCGLLRGTNTGAWVTDCSGLLPAPENPIPEALGWRFLGSFNHPGRTCNPAPVTNCNTNTQVPPDEGVSVSHEADPTPDGNWMFVTDERGGGVIPGGATCTPVVDFPIGNGGIHVFDISNPKKIEYAKTPDGGPAIFRGEPMVPAATFCDVHVIEQIPGEARIFSAYYTQGTKIFDYFIDEKGRWTMRETASAVLPGANTWTSDVFKIVDNKDGTRTYYILSSDIGRGTDVMTWTGPTNPIGTPPPATGAGTQGVSADVGFLGLGLFAIPALVRIRSRKR